MITRYIPTKQIPAQSNEVTPQLSRFSCLTICLHKLIKFAIIHHFLDNIESAHQFSINVQLREARISNYIVGDYVGQSEKVLRPCRTSSSASMLKNPYRTFFSRRIPTNVFENPHCGADGVPFMNNITGAALTNFASRSFRSSAGAAVAAEDAVLGGAGAGAVVSWEGGNVDVDVCNCSAVVREGGLAPEMRVRIFEFLTKTKKGTAVTSKVSATSASCSASI